MVVVVLVGCLCWFTFAAFVGGFVTGFVDCCFGLVFVCFDGLYWLLDFGLWFVGLLLEF